MRHPDAFDILMRLDELGVAIELDGDTILYRPASAVPDGLVERMREHKQELVAILRNSHCPPPSRYAKEFAAILNNISDPQKRAELRSRFEGRAALLTYSRGLPSDEADRLTLEQLRGDSTRSLET